LILTGYGVIHQDEIQVLQLQAGESKKDLCIPTLYFFLNLTVDG